jgi:NAD(P)H-hydrate epimerase
LNLLFSLEIPVIEISDTKTLEREMVSILHLDVWVDAIFGTGLKKEITGYLFEMITVINKSGKPVFAVDIPSGIDSDTGQTHGVSINADATATFAFVKMGHILFPGADHTGELGIVDIGIPSQISDKNQPGQSLLTPASVRGQYQPRASDAHKGNTGHLLVIAGSPGKTGAAAMTALSAMRAGAGLVTLGVPAGLHSVLESQVLEVMTVPLIETIDGLLDPASDKMIFSLLKDKKCLAIGPGLGTGFSTRELFLKRLAKVEIPVIIDADGINMLAENTEILKQVNIPVILTPHPGEMARLSGSTVKKIQRDRVSVSRIFAKEFNVYLVLKGASTVIAHPDGRVFICPTGNKGMASGGMGDALTGIIAGLIAQGYSPESSTHLGVWLHGAAADALARSKGVIGFLASEVISEIPSQISVLENGGTFVTDRMPVFRGL